MSPTEMAPGNHDAVDLDLLRQWITDCDPMTPIDPRDRRYFDLERVLVGGEIVSLRGGDHIAGLFDTIRLAGESSCQLFSGFNGTGKSTELRRLAQRLETEGYSVLLADARDYHTLSHPLTIEDMAVITVGALSDAAGVRLGYDLGKESYWTRLAELLQKEVQISDLKVPGLLDLKVGIRETKPFWLKIRGQLAVSSGRLRDDCHQFVRRCVAKIRNAEQQSRGVVFIFDSLERLNAPLGRFRELMSSMLSVLVDAPHVLHLPDCHVIYTVPPFVQLVKPGLRDLYHRVSHVLPAIKVAERGITLQQYQPGVDALMELVARRIPVDEVFGDRRDLLERLIVYSGGHVRTLITFIRDLLSDALRFGLPPSEEDVERVVQPFREQARIRVWRDSVLLLDRILETGNIEELNEEDHAVLAQYMADYLVLCYRNPKGWFEVHPLIREHVRELAAKVRGENTP